MPRQSNRLPFEFTIFLSTIVLWVIGRDIVINIVGAEKPSLTDWISAIGTVFIGGVASTLAWQQLIVNRKIARQAAREDILKLNRVSIRLGDEIALPLIHQFQEFYQLCMEDSPDIASVRHRLTALPIRRTLELAKAEENSANTIIDRLIATEFLSAKDKETVGLLQSSIHLKVQSIRYIESFSTLADRLQIRRTTERFSDELFGSRQKQIEEIFGEAADNHSKAVKLLFS